MEMNSPTMYNDFELFEKDFNRRYADRYPQLFVLLKDPRLETQTLADDYFAGMNNIELRDWYTYCYNCYLSLKEKAEEAHWQKEESNYKFNLQLRESYKMAMGRILTELKERRLKEMINDIPVSAYVDEMLKLTKLWPVAKTYTDITWEP